MPFKSEKQRRFLWATRPDIAKKWADKYPESNKGLPMYADKKTDKNDKSQPKEKAAQINIWSLFTKNEDSCYSASPSILTSNLNANCKKADSKQERVDIPRSEKPVYAGEEREKGLISSGDDLGDKNNGSCGKNAINELLQKLSVVLAPKIEQTMENLEAEREGRVPRRVGNNAGLKEYPIATPSIPLPMGMQTAQASQQPQQTQQSKPASTTPVGAGQSSATTDPIKFHSGLSASGIINGNAALSAPNTVNTKISAQQPAKKPKKKSYPINHRALAAGVITGSLLSKLMRYGYRNYQQGDYDSSYDTDYSGTDYTPDYSGNLDAYFKFSAAKNPILSELMGINSTSELDMLDLLEAEDDSEYFKAAVEKWAYDISNRRQSTNVQDLRTPEPSMFGRMLGYKAPPTYDNPAGIFGESPATLKKRYDDIAMHRLRAMATNNPHAKAVDRFVMDLKKPQPMSTAEQVNTQAATPTPPSSIAPETQGMYNRYAPKEPPQPPQQRTWQNMFNFNRKIPAFPAQPQPQPLPNQKAAASTPAWQRAAGKNDEGGLNAKGRASYNKATGGNLKAPVTEKNPSGERAKRQNSFCSRMCGMKRVNTGSKTKKDPDSRINKSLRKWNCKCSAAESFGKEAAKRVLNLSPSWGGQKWQLGEWGLNPQVGYRYLGGVVPTPDIALRLGGPIGGTAVGLAPLPYVETDWGRPSGRQANKETRSLYKWIGDGMRDRPTAAAHALANVPEDASAADYEAAMRSSGVGYSSKELKRLAERMAKMGPLQLPVE